MKSLSLESPAKINLFLKILGKLPGGYHELVTVFQRISLCDTLRFRRIAGGVKIRCETPGVPTDSSNLVARAFHLLKKRYPFKGGIEVELTKRIPAAGGLGGGSGNAAVTLEAVNRLFGLGVFPDELVYLGRELGADVPFFLLNQPTALGTGRGDLVQPLRNVSRIPLFLTFLPVRLSTREVYRAFKMPRKTDSLTRVTSVATMLSGFLSSKDFDGISLVLENDLSGPAIQMEPAVGRVLSFHRKLSPVSLMSGSGPTVFSLVSSPSEARSCAKRVESKFGFKTWAGSLI